MLEPLFGNKVVEKILFYFLTYETGYIRGGVLLKLLQSL